MRKTEADVIAFPTKTRLMCSSCGAPGEGSCRCGAPYVTPGERAEAAVRANPEKSNRMIAEEAGVSLDTVNRARNKTTERDRSVEKRTGKDGRTRKLPTDNKKFKAALDAYDRRKLAGEPVTAEAIAEETGASITPARRAIVMRKAQETAATDAKIILSGTAQQKLEIARRMMERKLNAEHAARMAQIDEEVRQRVLANGEAYLAKLNAMEEKARETVERYQRWTSNLKPIFTNAEFNTILKSLDSTAIAFRLREPDPEFIKRMDDAMALVRDKRDRLLLVKK